MIRFTEKARRFLVREDGPTAVEYAVMLAFVIMASIVTIRSLGVTVEGLFTLAKQKAYGGGGNGSSTAVPANPGPKGG